jgi:hypothetical protein
LTAFTIAEHRRMQDVVSASPHRPQYQAAPSLRDVNANGKTLHRHSMQGLAQQRFSRAGSEKAMAGIMIIRPSSG